MFEDPAKPFRPGDVIPSNRDPGGWHWTFVDANGEEHCYRVHDYERVHDARVAMRRWVAASGNQEMLEMVNRLYGTEEQC